MAVTYEPMNYLRAQGWGNQEERSFELYREWCDSLGFTASDREVWLRTNRSIHSYGVDAKWAD